ncbi:MAG: adenosylmethionine decarboxylase [Planctomycetota bacterium]
MKKCLGTHLLVDAWDCPGDLLDDPELVAQAVKDAIRAGDVTLINMSVHQFSPQGVTATATLAESHIALHTWPEHGYLALDIFFCGNKDPRPAIGPIRRTFRVGRIEVRKLRRGIQVETPELVEEKL